MKITINGFEFDRFPGFDFDKYDEIMARAEEGDIASCAMASIILLKAQAVQSGGDRSKALEILMWAASKGNGLALCELGNIYARGLFGVEEDPEKSLEMFRESAKQNHPEGAYHYAKILRIMKEYRTARIYFLAAAEQGHAEAMYELGKLYLDGKGGEMNTEAGAGYLTSAAESGCVHAQHYLAQLYFSGIRGVEKDMARSRIYFRMAADNGDVHSQSMTGCFCIFGAGGEKDLNEAKKYFHLAAVQGDAHAQYNLGIMYLNDFIDYDEALRWFRLSSDKGFGMSTYMLGYMYCKGLGVKMDFYQGYDWIRLASEQGAALATETVEKIRKGLPFTIEKDSSGNSEDTGDDAPRISSNAGNGFHMDHENRMSASEIMKEGIDYMNDGNMDMAMECFNAAAEKDYTPAQHMLGMICLHGYKGIDTDYHKASFYFDRAALKGCDKSLYYQGVMFSKGIACDQDYEKAMTCYMSAAEKGNDDAMNELGVMYSSGNGVAVDNEKAEEYYLQAARLGNAMAIYNLAKFYRNMGRYDEALQYATASAETGNAEGLFNMGILYLQGKGVGKDYSKALEYLLMASEKNHGEAVHVIWEIYGHDETESKYRSEAKQCFRILADKGNPYGMYYSGRVGLIEQKECREYNEVLRLFFQALEYEETSKVAAQIIFAIACYYYPDYQSEPGKDKDYAVSLLEKAVEYGSRDAELMLKEIETDDGSDEDRYIIEEFDNIEELYEDTGKGTDEGKTEAEEKDGQVEMEKIVFGIPDKYIDNYSPEETMIIMKKAEEGDRDALFLAGRFYQDGMHGVEINYKKTIECLEAAAAKGHAKAMNDLGFAYLEGVPGVDVDTERGLQLIKRSAESGDIKAASNYACFLKFGKYIKKDLKEARKYFLIGAEKGDAISQVELGCLYYFGKGGRKNYKQAAKWYLKAAEQNDAEAFFNAGIIYYHGHGVEKDLEKAREYFIKSYKLGYSQAKDVLDHYFNDSDENMSE